MPEVKEYVEVDRLKDSIFYCLYSGLVPIVVGPPGIGKARSVEELAEEINFPFQLVDLSQLDAVDLLGMPVVEGGCTRFARPTWLPEHDEKRLILLARIDRARKDVLYAAMRILEGRGTQSWQFNQRLHLLACTAQSVEEGQEGFQVEQVDKAILNRLCIIKTRPSKASVLYMLDKGLHPTIAQFLLTFQQYIHCMPVQRTESQFPTPRSWLATSSFLDKIDIDNLKPWMISLICANIGPEATSAFLKYIRQRDEMVDLDEVIYTKKPELVEKVKKVLAKGDEYAIILARQLGRKVDTRMEYTDKTKFIVEMINSASEETYMIFIKSIRDEYRHDFGLFFSDALDRYFNIMKRENIKKLKEEVK